jgi:hypothetical protein
MTSYQDLSRFAELLLTMVGQCVESRARAARVGFSRRLKLGPVPSITWVALGSDSTNATLLLYEVEECEDDIPRPDFSLIEKIGHVRGEAHFTS